MCILQVIAQFLFKEFISQIQMDDLCDLDIKMEPILDMKEELSSTLQLDEVIYDALCIKFNNMYKVCQ